MTSTKKKAKRLGRLKLTDFDSDTESVQMSRYLESEACASLYKNLKIRPADDKYICLEDDLFKYKSRRLSDSIHLRLSIDHLDIGVASPSEAETEPPLDHQRPRSSGMDESEAISNGFATISGLDDDNSLDNSRSSNDERNKSSSLESLILIDDDDDENDSNNRTAASNSNNNNNTVSLR
jgi:hypothetical protein